MRLVKDKLLIRLGYEQGIVYPSPASLSYLWNFGSLALFCLVIQLITGIFLAMHYAANVELAFNSVEHIMRDINYGWLIRYIHANGASMFFLVVYIHMFRGLYYGSYLRPSTFLWIVGVVILFVMIGTAFMGYVLPWGQMSFWAATVITNLASALPVVGKHIVYWLWGGFSVDNATLNRFFSFHYLLPFVLTGLVAVHLILLHEHGSNNPVGVSKLIDKIPFSPYFIVKDLFGVIVFVIFFGFILYYYPNLLGHPDNYIQANPLVTPAHIVPEWYFLPFYAILRSIPNKLGGVILMMLSIIILAVFPFFISTKVRSFQYKPINRLFYWFFVVDCILLGWIGGNPAETPYIEIGRYCTCFYFIYFIVLIPVAHFIEKNVYYSVSTKS